MKISKKLGITHLGLIFLITMMIGFIGYRLITNILQDTQSERLHLLANDSVHHIGTTLTKMGNNVSQLVDGRAMSVYQADFNDRPLRSQLNQQRNQYHSIFVLDESGQEEFSLKNGIFGNRNQSFVHDETFLDARWIPNTPSIRLLSTDENQAAQLVIAHVKKTFFDEFGGAIIAVSNLETLINNLVQLPDKTFVVLLDPQGRVAHRSTNNNQLPKLGTQLNCNIAAQTLASESDCLGVHTFQLEKQLNENGWSLIVGISHKDFIAPIIEIRNTIALALLIVIVIAIFISVLLARHIQRPLSALVAASQKLALGNRDVEVKVIREDEVGEVAQAFNQMSASLQQSNDQRDRALDGMSEANQELTNRLEELRLAQTRIEYMAYNDELTGLANRRLLMDRLENTLASAIRHGQRGALLMLDLDRFKNINDSLGHDAGDRLIKQVGQRLIRAVREEDTVSRLGGDEFVVLLPQVDVDGDDVIRAVTKIAEKIRSLLAEPYQLDRHRYHATPSIGLVIFPRQDDDSENLLKRADTAMYRAKQEVGNKVCFYEIEMQVAADERLHLEKDLLQSLSNKELFLAYQAQCNADGQIESVETLLRWHHPEWGTLTPGRFIPIAEETGLIITLGNWILEQACSDISTLLTNDSAHAISAFTVNVSPLQFRDKGFTDAVLKTISEYQMPAGLLKLELTETALLDNVDMAIARMEELRAAGIRFSLDDFGTGYSSLSYLNKLPLDEIKIDHSFLTNAKSNPRAWALIEAVVGIADALDLGIVVEGVEDKETLDKLCAIGCKRFQGYYFAKPQTFNKFHASFTRQSQEATLLAGATVSS